MYNFIQKIIKALPKILKAPPILKDKRSYLFLGGFALILAFCWFFVWAFNSSDQRMLKEKVIDRQIGADLISVWIDKFVERDNDWGVYDYSSTLSFVVAFLDASSDSRSYAELFDTDINSISGRSPFFEGEPFDPKDYPELMEAVRQDQNGHETVLFDKGGVPPHDLYLYYRWIPTDDTLENRLLLIVGVSKYSINTSIGAEVTWVAVACIVVTAFLIMGCVLLYCRLGVIYDQRTGNGGKKWRSKISS